MPSRFGPDHAEAMATKGLRCEGASGARTVPIHASTTTDGIGPCDLVIIATKSFDVEAAARSCRPLLGPETIVQTTQNGLGSPEIAGPILGADRVAGRRCRRFRRLDPGAGTCASQRDGDDPVRRICRAAKAAFCKPRRRSGNPPASRSRCLTTSSRWCGKS